MFSGNCYTMHRIRNEDTRRTSRLQASLPVGAIAVIALRGGASAPDENRVHRPVLKRSSLIKLSDASDRGHSVDIYASGPREDPKCHTDVEQYKRIGRTFYGTASMSARLRDCAARSAANPAKAWEAVRTKGCGHNSCSGNTLTCCASA